MPALALDIGTYTIKAVYAKPGKQPEIIRVVEIFNPLGVSLPTDDNQMEKLGQTLDTLIKDNNFSTTDVRLALPETVVSTKVISLPRLTDAELASAINWQAEQHIPIPPEELSLEYQVLYRPPKSDPNSQMRVLLVGVRKAIIERYVTLFTNLGIEPTILETQTISVIRAAQFEPTDPTTLVIHLGASTMNMAIVHQGLIEFVITHLSGGQVLTRALEQQIGLDAAQSEGYKRTYGLDEGQFQGKVRQALLPGVKMMVSEFAKALRFFASQHPSDAVKRVLLSGGAAQLPGFFQYITQELGVEVLLAAPFAQTKGVAPDSNHAALTVCIGLLMRES